MSLFFDARELGDPADSYVAWLDVMGMQCALRRSASVAANFVYKMHDAALQARIDGIRLYPVMDGVYATAGEGATMEGFLRSVFKSAAEEFVGKEKPWFRFVVRGSVAKGQVYHGADLKPDASWRLRDSPFYRDHILLGVPMVDAYLGETEAPPFGLYVHESALHFTSESSFPFDVWWRWYGSSDNQLVDKLREALGAYYDWCTRESKAIGYPPGRIRLHRGQAMLYLSNG